MSVNTLIRIISITLLILSDIVIYKNLGYSTSLFELVGWIYLIISLYVAVYLLN